MLRKQAHLSGVTYLNMKKKHKDMGRGDISATVVQHFRWPVSYFKLGDL